MCGVGGRCEGGIRKMGCENRRLLELVKDRVELRALMLAVLNRLFFLPLCWYTHHRSSLCCTCNSSE